jgi:exopolysaccharide biosynthesis polyprenyl glycosylphosphotransferase
MDAAVVLAAAMLDELIRFGSVGPSFSLGDLWVPHAAAIAVLVPSWVLMLAITGAYDARLLGSGFDEYRRVVSAALRMFAVLAILLYLADSNLSRTFVAVLVPAIGLATIIGRNAARKALHRARAAGKAMSRVLVVGTGPNVREMAVYFQRTPWAGYSVVGACVPLGNIGGLPSDVPAFESGSPEDVLEALDITGADVLAVTDTTAVPIGALRLLSWRLEGTGVELVVAPAVTDIAGPRINIRPVAGLPLLHVEEPRFDGAPRVFKGLLDRGCAAVALLCLAPLIAIAALAIRVTSSGPVLYRQIRVGRAGREFTMLKFRTMCDNADAELAQLLDLNQADGPMFKIHDDPRITPLGRVLRRLSFDELPQLVNVLRGEMSIVGPRPPLPSEVDRYPEDVRRRFLVKPGLTGLWQVSGRSDLSWEDSVRLDLDYVDHWSPALDFVIMLKTVLAVIKGAGAY